MKKKGNGIVLADILINVAVLVFCVYNIYQMFHENAQANIGVENLFGMYWIIAAAALAVFLVLDFLYLRSRRKGRESGHNEAYVIMSILIKGMVAVFAVLYKIIV